MPRQRGTGKGESARITLRFEPEELAYYGKRAQVAGVSTSAFIRQRLVEGMVAESLADIEVRLAALAYLDHPAMRLLACLPSLGSGLLAPTDDLMDLPVPLVDAPQLCVTVAGIGANKRCLEEVGGASAVTDATGAHQSADCG